LAAPVAGGVVEGFTASTATTLDITLRATDSKTSAEELLGLSKGICAAGRGEPALSSGAERQSASDARPPKKAAEPTNPIDRIRLTMSLRPVSVEDPRRPWRRIPNDPSNAYRLGERGHRTGGELGEKREVRKRRGVRKRIKPADCVFRGLDMVQIG